MTPLELLNLANEAYPDGYLREYYQVDPDAEPEGPADPADLFNAEGSGDSLAECIVIELLDAYRENPNCTDAELLAIAADSLDRLVEQIAEVALHLAARREEVLSHG